MADGPDPSTRVPVTAVWQAEMERRRLAYAGRRRRWTAAWLAGAHPEPPTDDGEPGPRSGRTIHNKPQLARHKRAGYAGLQDDSWQTAPVLTGIDPARPWNPGGTEPANLAAPTANTSFNGTSSQGGGTLLIDVLQRLHPTSHSALHCRCHSLS